MDNDIVAVIGAGPAGLMAAETIAAAGRGVVVFDHMPSVGRKLLIAGRGGLNLTHGEPRDAFLGRYGGAEGWLTPAIVAFPPAALIAWAEGLGQEIFTGSSGRVFPRAMKSSPLLRAWLARLDAQGVRIATRHRWIGRDENGMLRFDTPSGLVAVHPAASVLALGGASWPRLGSDGGWQALLPGIRIAPLVAANCGMLVAWSEMFRARHSGMPLKRIAITFRGRTVRGEAMVTQTGLEGGAIYALSAALRDGLAVEDGATLTLDLRPDLPRAALAERVAAPRRGQSLSTFLRKAAGLSPPAIGLVQEALHAGSTGADLAALIKALPLTITGMAGLARAISSAGGIVAEECDAHFMLRQLPGVFVCGEMLDWEAPTGGYLLQACFATGVAAGSGVLAYLDAQ
ncbi:TIGR03862 family flavoprotein [Elioraea sp.]|uniref:NAD(P)/FAD-dependent oxidoreductase n=1 Tax=Elioraea sp. TaxID=2185103 RepID=UPI0025C398D4|nr:TIGR03862 family flavoprotein [Elioraea sp.]